METNRFAALLVAVVVLAAASVLVLAPATPDPAAPTEPSPSATPSAPPLSASSVWDAAAWKALSAQERMQRVRRCRKVGGGPRATAPCLLAPEH